MQGQQDQSTNDQRDAPEDPLRRQVERVGTQLADSFSRLLSTLSSHSKGPRALANHLGITTVTASRLLKGIAQTEAVAVIQQVPGAPPMRDTIEAAREQGAPGALASAARAAVDSFEELIRTQAGDRRSLNAMISDWLPESRRELEARSRQSIFKGISELKGVSCDLILAPMILHAAPDDRIDVIAIEVILGLDRLRPDANVQLGMVRPLDAQSEPSPSAPAPARGPLTLDGEPIADGLHSARLDEFCTAAPAPLVAKRVGDGVQYILGDSGCGASARLDLVLAQLHPSEIPDVTKRSTPPLLPPSMAYIPAAPAKTLMLDIIVHRDVYAGWLPELMVYDIAYRGPVVSGSVEREFDLLRVSESVEHLGPRSPRWRCARFPRYLELLDTCFDKTGWDAREFQAYRVRMVYPLHGTQVGVAFRPPSGG